MLVPPTPICRSDIKSKEEEARNARLEERARIVEESRRSYEDRVRREEDEIAAREHEVGFPKKTEDEEQLLRLVRGATAVPISTRDEHNNRASSRNHQQTLIPSGDRGSLSCGTRGSLSVRHRLVFRRRPTPVRRIQRYERSLTGERRPQF